jgi:putative endonuclease
LKIVLRRYGEGVDSSAYTYSRRPVKLVWTSEEVKYYYDALRWERQIKGWSCVKKQALIEGKFEVLHEIVKTERRVRENNKKKLPR